MRKTSLNSCQGNYPPAFHPLEFVVVISLGITDAAVVFVSIWYNHTTNEKALWLEFDVAFIKFPKVLEFIVYDCHTIKCSQIKDLGIFSISGVKPLLRTRVAALNVNAFYSGTVMQRR